MNASSTAVVSEKPTYPVNREALYAEVWAEPVSTVALRYGLSDVGLAKICRALAIPLPSRGYWAKVKAGRVMAKAPLPKLQQHHQDLSRLVKLPPEQVAMRDAELKSRARARSEVEALHVDDVTSTPPHPLVRAAAARLKKRDGWSAETPVRSAPKEVLNISATPSSLDRALTFTDSLLKMLMKHGFDFEIDDARGASLFRKIETGTKLEFALVERVQRTRHVPTPAEELARKKYWERPRFDRSLSLPIFPQFDYAPTGILTLEIGRWPKRTWKDSPTKNLELRLGEVMAGILAVASGTFEREQEQARREEARRQAEAHYDFLVKRRSQEAERFKRLESSATDWERAAKLRAFADAVENDAKLLGPLTVEQIEWLAWARAKADWLDPLVRVSDPILDAPEPKRPGYF
ncbi:MAG: hypothetical protein K2X55_13030 [Burkholderiaceae bacterium]|nr:hypothetical protein [Burkholderiaceae bacterium]